MKKQFTVFVCAVVAVCMMLSMAACGASQQSSSASAATSTAEAPASSVNSMVEATKVESTEDPNTLAEQTIVGTVVGASAKNIFINDQDGCILLFPLVDSQVADVEGFDESDWVTITYQGTIVDDDATSVVVNAVTENGDEAVKAADALAFTDVDAQTLYTTGPVDVREDYKTGTKDTATLDKGTEVTLTGTADYGWKRIECDGKTYYFAGDYLVDKAAENALEDVDLVASASEAAAASATKSTMDAGEVVGGVQAGYADTYYTTVNLRMRAAPSTDAQVLGVAKAGTAVGITDMIGNWAQVYYDGGVAYCDFDYLSSTPLSNTVVTVTNGIPEGVSMVNTDETMYTTVALHIRSTCATTGSILGTAPAGTALHVTGILDNHWSQVEYAGTTGYCVTQFLSSTQPVKQVTIEAKNDEVWTIATVYVRAQPSLGGTIYEAVNTGYEFTRTGITSDLKWSEIDYNGGKAYVASQYLTTQQPSQMNANNPTFTSVDETVRTTADLRLHSDCSTSSQIYTTMPAGTVINRVAVGSNGWSQVIYAGQIGYCASEYLAY